MKTIKLVLLSIIFLSPIAKADDECTSNSIGFDTCEYAKEFADEFATQLPMRMSQNLVLEKVVAVKNIVGMHVILGYNEDHLLALSKQNGVSIEQINQTMIDSTKANLCQQETPTEALISLGGRVQYVYKYSDGMPYLTVDIGNCL